MQINAFTQLLSKIKSSGYIEPLDFYLANFLTEKSALTDPIAQQRFAFLVLWLSMEVRTGHVCILLSELKKQAFSSRFDPHTVDAIFAELADPTIKDWIDVCCSIENQSISNGDIATPLVLDKDRLYFHRMWMNECNVADYFYHTAVVDNIVGNNISLEQQKILTSLFPVQTDQSEVDWQKIAVAVAMTQKNAIISGGPGTGKTTTVAKIFAALLLMKQSEPQPQPQHISSLRIIAAAPTGKAAARLTESLGNAIASLTVDEHIKKQLPIDALTLHRLLGARVDSNEYIYNKNNQLHVDILLVDEASMVDLSMMASLLEALPKHARLILLGDKEQLSSVEAGAIFGDLCELLNKGYSEQQVQILNQLTGYSLVAQQSKPSIADSICLLQKSYRFSADSGIGQLANYIKAGQASRALSLFEKETLTDIHYQSLDYQAHYNIAITQCVEYYRHYLNKIKTDATDISGILQTFSQFRLICALRDGPYGIKGLNREIESLLQQKQLIHQQKNDVWYIGRPIMILKNSASLGVYNGDIGITLPSLDDPKKLRVYFAMADGSIKGFSPFRLPENETAYAMTVHKSQGSEFDTVSIILPTEFSPLLTRSLLYTAVTRAKQKVSLYAAKHILERTINSQIQRQSGLVDKLH